MRHGNGRKSLNFPFLPQNGLKQSWLMEWLHRGSNNIYQNIPLKNQRKPNEPENQTCFLCGSFLCFFFLLDILVPPRALITAQYFLSEHLFKISLIVPEQSINRPTHPKVYAKFYSWSCSI